MMKTPKNKYRRNRKDRRSFPKVIASHAEQTATVMVVKKMTTARYVFDSPMGQSMVMVTLDPKVVEAITMALEALGTEIKPADQVEAPEADAPPLVALEGGVAALALEGTGVGDLVGLPAPARSTVG